MDNSNDKASPGQPFRAPRAETWNGMVDAGNAYRAGRLNVGAPPPTRPRQTDLVRIKNNSGADRAKCEILLIDGKAITDLTEEHIWLLGDEPTADGYFGILKEPIASGKIGVAQVSGCCLAMVDISDTGHTRAKAAAGLYVLESSADDGPLEILYQPGTTGEVECVVRFAGGGGGADPPDWGVIIKTPAGGIAGRSGTTVTSGSCDVFSIVGTTLTDTGVNIDVFNTSLGAIGASVYGTAKREYASGKWVIDLEDCTTG